jgi:tRNA dimethylallyltransferase
MTGGSGLYMDSIINGIDNIPDPDPETRAALKEKIDNEGIDSLLAQLAELDPDFFQQVDKKNPARVLRGLEVCLSTGKPFSSFRKRAKPLRNFLIRLFCLELPREELYERIDLRVDQMMAKGLVAEARDLYPHRQLSALNTVGYRELFDFFDGKIDLEEAVRLIKRNTRHYARRQITWNNRYDNLIRVSPNRAEQIIKGKTPI